MRHLISALAVMSCGLTAVGGVEEPMGLLLVGGPFHADEVQIDPGEGWLGLFPIANAFELAPTRVTVSVVHDAILDPDDEATGKQVSVDREPSPIVLLPASLGLVEGKVAGIGGEWELAPGRLTTLQLGEKRYQLFSLEEGEHPDTPCEVILDDGRVRQVLERLDRCDEDKYPALLWAGDLDGDGRIDLLLDATDSYNVSDVTLYLSGQNLARVAHLRTVGC